MRKFIIIMLCFWIFGISSAYAVEIPQIAGENEFNRTAEDIASGKNLLNPIDLINDIKDKVIGEVTESSDIMLTFIILAAMSGVLAVVQSAVKNDSVCEITFIACFSVVSIVAVRCFLLVLGYAKDVIVLMSEFITKLSPLLLSLVLSSGKASSAMAFKPILTAAVYVITVVVEKCLVPLISYGAVLTLVNNISGKVQISNYTKLIQSFSKWIMTGVLTMFTGITAIYGFSTPTLDALGARAAKFAVGSFVPVVGGLLSDTLETVVGGSMLVKNAVGTAGVITICTMCLVPIIKIAVIIFMIKAAAAAAEPLADRRIVNMLQDISSISTTVLAMVITVSVMFIICISIIIAATNG